MGLFFIFIYATGFIFSIQILVDFFFYEKKPIWQGWNSNLDKSTFFLNKNDKSTYIKIY